MSKPIYEFGAFYLDPYQRILLHHGEHLRLQPKTFETLLALVEQAGQVVRKEDLMQRIWPDTFVEEINLTKNISTLRKTLRNGNGAGEFIETIPTVGYRFVAAVRPVTNGNGQVNEQIDMTVPALATFPTSATSRLTDEAKNTALVSNLIQLPTVAPQGWFVGIFMLLLIGSAGWFFLSDQRQETERAAAERLYATGRYFWNQRTIEGLRKGLTCFEQAVDLDPQYAPAWTGIADSWNILVEYDFISAPEGYPKAKKAVLRALDLDANLAEAHATLATIKAYYEWDWVGAERSFQQAIALQPDYAPAHQWYAEVLALQQRPQEARAEIQRARELDPASRIIQATEAGILSLAHDYEEALAKAQQLLAHDPHFAEVYSYLGAIYEYKKMFREAMDAFEKRSVMMGDNTPTASAIRTAPIRDARDYWEKRARLEEVKLYGSAFDKAQALAQLGRAEEAITLLEQSCQPGAAGVKFLKVSPHFDSLRNHSRFQALLRRTNLLP
jgi:DNA-binding winged helix-turn-helix (wHTH) protein/tetratricopeptide (TPR) repeat protein